MACCCDPPGDAESIRWLNDPLCLFVWELGTMHTKWLVPKPKLGMLRTMDVTIGAMG